MPLEAATSGLLGVWCLCWLEGCCSALLPVNFMPLRTKDEEWLAVKPWACMSSMCFNLPFNKFEVCKQSPTERCYLAICK